MKIFNKEELKIQIIQLLDNNKEGIKKSFKIDDNEIKNIKEFLNKDHKDFSAVIDDMSASNLSDRGRMVACCLIGYINGTLKAPLFNR